MKRLSTIFSLLLSPVMAFGQQSICQSQAVAIQPYNSQTGTGVPQAAALPELGYFATGSIYAALPGMPDPPRAFCGPPWQPNYPYVVGDMIEPLAPGAVFQAVSNPNCLADCKSGSTQPPGFGGTLILPSNTFVNITTCSETGTTATCTMVGPAGDPAPLNIFEPYQGAVVGSTVVIQNYVPNHAYDGSWVVTASTNPPGPPFATPFTFSFTAPAGLAPEDCTKDVGLTACIAYQQGTRVADGGIVWQYAGPQTEVGPTVVVTPSPFSITTAQPLDVTVAVGGAGMPAPTGTVTVTSGTYVSAAATLSTDHTITSATITIPAGSLVAGLDTLTGKYSGDSNYGAATGINAVTVTGSGLLTPTVTVTPSASNITTADSLDVMITVSGGSGHPTPTGTVTLTGGGYTSPSTTLSGGSAKITIPAGSLAVGMDTLTASYLGDSNYTNGTGTASVTVTQAVLLTPTVTVTPAASSITTTEPLNVTIAVSGGSGHPTPTGAVTLASGSYNSGPTTLSSGGAMITVPAGMLAVGMDTLTADYLGDSNYNPATGTATVTVTNPNFKLSAAPSSMSIAQGGSGTSTITVTPAGGFTGSVTLAATGLPSGVTAAFGTNPASGTSLLTLTASSSATVGGPNTVTITGTSGSLLATTTIALTVSAAQTPGFTIAGTAVSVSPGATTGNTSTITVTSVNGFTGEVMLTAVVASRPAGAQDLPTFSFKPSSVNVAQGTPGTATLTIFTTPSTGAALAYPARPGARRQTASGRALLAFALLFGMVIVFPTSFVPARRRSWRTRLGMMLLLVTMIGGLLACGSSGAPAGNSGTTPGSYTVTVTGTSGSTTATGTVTLTVL